MNKKIIACVIATLSSASVLAGGVPSHPDQVISSLPTNVWYLSLNGGGTVIGNITKNGNKHTGFEGAAGTLYGGFQYDDTWAAEAGISYHSMGSFGNFEIYDIAVKASMPMSASTVVFAKLGGAAYTSKVCDGGCATETRGAPFFGGGFGFQLSPYMRATVEYDGIYATAGYGDGSMGAVTGGLTYYFL